MLSFFPRGVLDEILILIESVSEDFLSYSCSKGKKTETALDILALRRTMAETVLYVCVCVCFFFFFSFIFHI